MEPDDLYGLPLDTFVAQRAALAKALRGEGRRDEADAVKALRKPSVAAWTVNQLVREHRAEIDALLRAGDGLRAAQEALMGGGGDAAALRAAQQDERAAVDALVAADLAGVAGGAVLDRVAATLHAAAFDADAREAVLAGTLVRELQPVGLGFGGAGAAPAAPAPAPPRIAERPAAEAGDAEEGRRAAQREAAERAAAEARAEAERAAGAMQYAERDHEAAREAAADAGDEVERAEQALAQVREDQAAADAAREQASAALERAQVAADAARARLEDATAALAGGTEA